MSVILVFLLYYFYFYLPYLSSILEKVNCVAIFWTGRPHSLGGCHFRGVWATCLPHKGCVLLFCNFVRPQFDVLPVYCCCFVLSYDCTDKVILTDEVSTARFIAACLSPLKEFRAALVRTPGDGLLARGPLHRQQGRIQKFPRGVGRNLKFRQWKLFACISLCTVLPSNLCVSLHFTI